MEKFYGIASDTYPGKRSVELNRQRQKHIPDGFISMMPVFVEKAEDALITDVDGNHYIDFAGGLGVATFGHNHPKVVSAIREQAEKYIHPCSMVMMHEPFVKVAVFLNESAPGTFHKKTCLFNSGAEAVENAVKIARKYTQKKAIISLEYAFHGRTLLALSLTSQINPFKTGFGPFAPETYKLPAPYCYRCPLNLKYPECSLACAHLLERTFKFDCPAGEIAAFIAEPILGEGGIIIPPLAYFKVIAEICKQNDILLIMDEIQVGFYRTGRLFASEHFGVEADMYTCGKALGGGLPISAVIGRQEIMDSIKPGEIGGTFCGNPIPCAAAVAMIEVMKEEKPEEKICRIESLVGSRLKLLHEKCSLVGNVRGLGSVHALELVIDRNTKEPAVSVAQELVNRCHRKGLCITKTGMHGNVIRLLMPITISDRHLVQGLDIIEDTLLELDK